MPEITSLEIAASAVRKGDWLDEVAMPSVNVKGGKTIYANGHMVESIKTGQANTVFETTGGKVVVTSTAIVTVRHEVETAEEKQAKHEAMIAELRTDLTHKVNKWVTGAAATRAEALERMAASELTDHWDADKFLAANARVKIAGRVQHVMDRARDQKLHLHEGECNHERTDEGYRCNIEGRPTTEWDGVQVVFKMLTRDLLKSAVDRRVLSRSTSLTSNLMEDLEAEALAGFFADFRYQLARDLDLVSPYTAVRGLDL